MQQPRKFTGLVYTLGHVDRNSISNIILSRSPWLDQATDFEKQSVYDMEVKSKGKIVPSCTATQFHRSIGFLANGRPVRKCTLLFPDYGTQIFKVAQIPLLFSVPVAHTEPISPHHGRTLRKI